MDGFFYVNKPKGITSFSVCHKIQRAYNIKKCGHNGTLDPDATGVMMVACGKATKLLPFFNIHDKAYIAGVEFGYETTTLDSSGEVINEGNSLFTKEEVLNAIEEVISSNMQIPPMYSAIKINGQKMVDLARKNKSVDLPAREISYLSKPQLLDIYEKDGKTNIIIKLEVSKGFYVRSFCRDLGYKLNSYATMTDLNRIASGNIKIEQTSTLEDIVNQNGKFYSIDEVLADFVRLDVNDYIAKLVKNGVVLDERQTNCKKNLLIYHQNQLIAVYEYKEDNTYHNVVIL